MSEWRWLGLNVILAAHDRQIAEHGGLEGVRDLGAIEAALDRPQNIAAYTSADTAALAAAYAFGLARNHGFADGNKRLAWISARLFLKLNGVELRYDPAEAVELMLDLASGNISEDDLAHWFRARSDSE